MVSTFYKLLKPDNTIFAFTESHKIFRVIKQYISLTLKALSLSLKRIYTIQYEFIYKYASNYQKIKVLRKFKITCDFNNINCTLTVYYQNLKKFKIYSKNLFIENDI